MPDMTHDQQRANLMRRDEAYSSWVADLKERYQRSQIKASIAVNSQLLAFYWQLGRDIVGMQAENRYGSGFYATLSSDLKRELPGAKGFTVGNLRYMRRFYELFSTDEIRPQLGDDSPKTHATSIHPQVADELLYVPWGHIKLLIDKCKGDQDKALFYVRKTVENGWSRAVLANFLETDLYERQGKAVSNFALTLPATQSDLAQEMTKDPYQFDFLTIRTRYDERELKDALMDNIT